jgi:flagellar basal-body rod modification protein FlgD
MDLPINTTMSGQELAMTKAEVDNFNKTLNAGKASKTSLGQDDFLKLLIAQLQHQDPTAPLDDKEFISQMAQFSSLEQITNMNAGFQKLSGLLASSQAEQSLGKTVEIQEGDSVVRGVVEKVMRGDNPLVSVNGSIYEYSQIGSIIGD